MHKIKYILFLLIAFLFSSCGEIFLDLSDVHYELDKSTYAVNEPITLSYYGSFEDSSAIGYIKFYFTVSKLNEDEGCKVLKFADDYTPGFVTGVDDGHYFDVIKDSEKMTSFREKITFSISEVGTYKMVVHFTGSTSEPNHLSGCYTFTLPITITE